MPSKTSALLARLLALPLSCAASIRADAPSEPLPHIVYIMADDLGYGDPGCYNAESKIPTPNIDRLAAEGLRFTDAHAPGSWCVPSRYGLLTGRYPFRATLNWRSAPCIADDRPTLAQILRDAGYHASMVGKWHLGFTRDGWDKPLVGGPTDRGFHDYFGVAHSTDIQPYYYIVNNRVAEPPTEDIAAKNTPGWSPIQGEFWRAGKISPGLKIESILPHLTDRAVAVIQQHAPKKRQPLFLYFALTAPHTPWLPSPEFSGVSGADLYGDFTAMVDHAVGRVLAALDQAGMAENAMVIFTSDNGPVWYDRDARRFRHDSQGPLRGMKGDAWEAGHRVPFIVRWPGVAPAGAVSRQLLCFTDMFATFAQLTGRDPKAGGGEDSLSMLSVFRGERPDAEPVRTRLLTVASGGRTLAARLGPWKFIPQLGSAGFSAPKRVEPTPNGPKGQLYNLEADLSESNNLYQERPDLVARFSEWLADH